MPQRGVFNLTLHAKLGRKMASPKLAQGAQSRPSGPGSVRKQNNQMVHWHFNGRSSYRGLGCLGYIHLPHSDPSTLVQLQRVGRKGRILIGMSSFWRYAEPATQHRATLTSHKTHLQRGKASNQQLKPTCGLNH